MKTKYILDKEQLEKRLKELAETPYTGERSYGAMCYSPFFNGEYEEYKCKICGEITEHTGHTLSKLRKIQAIVTELIDIGFDIQLDESEYCQYCNKDFKKNWHKPVLKIRFDQNDDYHTAETHFDEDYYYLRAFLKGQDHFIDRQDFTCVINENIDIINKMTGLGNETVKEWLKDREKSV